MISCLSSSLRNAQPLKIQQQYYINYQLSLFLLKGPRQEIIGRCKIINHNDAALIQLTSIQIQGKKRQINTSRFNTIDFSRSTRPMLEFNIAGQYILVEKYAMLAKR